MESPMFSIVPLLVVVSFASESQSVGPKPYSVGVSKVDVTPSYPVRLHGFGFRKTESEGVKQHLFAKALAIGDEQPFVLITVDNLGVPRWMTEQVAKQLAKYG